MVRIVNGLTEQFGYSNFDLLVRVGTLQVSKEVGPDEYEEIRDTWDRGVRWIPRSRG